MTFPFDKLNTSEIIVVYWSALDNWYALVPFCNHHNNISIPSLSGQYKATFIVIPLVIKE